MVGKTFTGIRHHNMCAALGAITVALLSQPVAAQTSSSAQSDIVVTAQKQEQKLQDVPATVSVLSEKTLETQKILRFEDIAAATPGFSVINAGAGRNMLTIRGVTSGSGQFTNSVGVYLDDIPVGSSNAANNGSLDTGDFDTFDLARVEVLQGPQGTLYGTNTLGGLVHYVFNQPDTKAFGGKVEVGMVDVAHGNVGVSVKGVVNVPLSDTTALRVSGFHRIDPGYIDNRGPYTANNENKDKYEGGRASLLSHLTDRLTVNLTGYYQHIKSNGSNAIDVDPTTLKPVFGDYARQHSYPEGYDSKYALGALTATLDLDWANLTSVTSYSDMKNNETYDFTPYYASAYASVFGLTSSQLATPGVTSAHTKKLTQEVRLASKGSGPLTWQLGGFFDDEHSRFTYQALPYLLPSLTEITTTPLRASDNPSTYRDLAAFANATYAFTPDVSLQLGARFNNNHQTFNPLSYGSQRATVATSGTSDENAFTFLVSPSWHVTKDVMLYARVSKGYRAGGPNATGSDIPANFPKTFKSDTLISYEAGIKADAFGRMLTYDLSLYHIDWSNIQLSTTFNGQGIAGNGGKATVDGAQGNLTVTPTRTLTFSGNASYNNARLAADAPDVSGLKGDRLPTVPKWAVSANADWRSKLTDTVTGNVGATYTYSGSRYSDYSQAGRVIIPGYSQVDFRAGLDFDRYTLSLVVRNAFDKKAFSNIEIIAAYANAYRIQPRTVGIYGTVKF